MKFLIVGIIASSSVSCFADCNELISKLSSANLLCSLEEQKVHLLMNHYNESPSQPLLVKFNSARKEFMVCIAEATKICNESEVTNLY